MQYLSSVCFFIVVVLLGSSCQSSTTTDSNVTISDSLSDIKPDEPRSYILYSNKDGAYDTIVNQYAKFYEPITLYAEDSLPIKGNYYHAKDDAKSILLCHQAGWNKYEYDSIAVALQASGYNCLAIDQRSGGIMGINGEGLGPVNQTVLNAQKAQKAIDYLDARQDIRTAINYLATKNKKPIILWGSSYSSTLAIYLGINNENVAAVISFSPGDYFADTIGSIVPILKETEKPFFLTSSLKEAPEITAFLKGKKLTDKQVQFIPKGEGYHGSRALWSFYPGNEEYWDAISAFLKNLDK